MLKHAFLVIVLAAAVACGGGKKKEPEKPMDPGTTEPTGDPTAGGSAAPTEPAKPVEPPKPAGPSPEELAKQAAAEQVEAGKKAYGEKGCNTCHGEKGEGNAKKAIPVLIGDKALPEKADKKAKARKTVKFVTAKDLHDFVKAKMPPKKAGTLTDDEAAALTAWLLTENKVTLDKKLDAEGMASVNIRAAAAAQAPEKAPEKAEKAPAKK